MKHELSVLIPVYQDDCREQVISLSRQLEAAPLERYEIIVADDGSKDRRFIELCREVNSLPHVRFIERTENVGRSCIRNFLAREASYEWLLFIDAELIPSDDQFISRYIENDGEGVVCGDYLIGECDDSSNLRYRYEMAIASQHSISERRKRPYMHFHTANFLVAKQLILKHPFDERFHKYGYEDVLFGKQLRQSGIRIEHIDNPVVFDYFEPNERFVSKTEDSLLTLHDFRQDLRGYSRMLTFAEGIHLNSVRWLIRLWHRLFGRIERKLLCSNHPNLSVFKAYKLGYYLTIEHNNSKHEKKICI